MKTCTNCKRTLNESNFYTRKSGFRKGTLLSECKDCYCNRDKINSKKEGRKERKKERYREIRTEVLEHYGSVCACCGESRYEFLAIDHINGGGLQHRKELNILGDGLYYWLRKNNYPDGFRVLCHNCNSSLGFYGYCPHKK